MTSTPARVRRFYGWPLVGVGFLVYGLGIAPGYYSWGFFAPEMVSELGLSREQVGGIFGVFTLTLSLCSPLAALSIDRWGLRPTVTLGALLAAVGFFLVGRADSVAELYLSYGILGGVGLGFSTLLPAQALAIYWFKKYRARATAVILLGAAVVGALVNPIDAVILRYADWRAAWVLISGSSILVALIAAVFLRNRPEDLGQVPDGRVPTGTPEAPASEPELQSAIEKKPAPSRASVWKLAESSGQEEVWSWQRAIRTPQFLVVVFAGVANVVPWRFVTAHGRLHFEDLGFAPAVAAAILGLRVGISAVGRLSGSLGDFLAPTGVLALALVSSGLGLGGLLLAETTPVAYASVALLGVGYGAAFTSEPVVLARFFGRAAFVGTSGLRLGATGIMGWLVPTWAGAVADRTGSYDGAITLLMVVCSLGAVAILFCRAPSGSRHQS